ncbi:GNAT family N-acetyltransferase [Phenylobacterium sp.]|jgi:RimJ/RimL family protein N-acetyltransferase|uniref:GNAT family N-acetyltransferase n=1 Tax=Phenylobacterium sp. TaxID=1871053 RepID=UPI0037CA1CFD
MCAVERWPEIGTDRLVLRAPVATDAPLIAELANDPVIARNTARLPHPYGLAEAEAFLSAVAAQDPRRNRTFAVEDRQFGLVGVLGFDERRPQQTEVGYWLGRPFWGRGYATEALVGALRWAAAAWGRRAVWAGHFDDNNASGQVLIKAGFLYTGEIDVATSLGRSEPARSRRMVWLA